MDAFKAGAWIESWSDMGCRMKYESFGDWYNEQNFKKGIKK